MVVFDTATIVLVIDPKSRPPVDPATGIPVTKCKERIDYLIKTLGESRTRILIPTPVLAEFLVKAGPSKDKFLKEFLSNKNFLVCPFDQRAAIELAYLEDAALKSERTLDPTQTKAKVKFDRQIAAIAKIQEADCIYTDDGNLAKIARANGMRTVMTCEIPLPPENPQQSLPLLGSEIEQ
ncbi:MAG: PIN domain-containing protein [Pseudomonadota bacterium]